MKTLVSAGEIVVEVMAQHRGQSLGAAGPLTGPYPSGAPAIFLAQAAALGQACGMIGAVGDDAFGALNLDRLRGLGVDVSAVACLPGRATGSAFVSYRADGSRQFVFNIRHSAAAELGPRPEVRALLGRADHLHVMGSSLFSDAAVAMAMAGIAAVKGRGGTVSFDPNIRPEMMTGPMHAALADVLAATDLFLPSGDEIFLFAPPGVTDADAAAADLLARGIRAVVQKRGMQGAVYFDATQRIAQPAFAVTEVDPTGAGDCFGGAFVALWLRGAAPARALQLAAACGALAVTHQGPMEGICTLPQIEAFLAAQRGAGAVAWLAAFPVLRQAGARPGIVSVCSAHPRVIAATLRHGRHRTHPVLIEATCNQVNHRGGYTGQTPALFRDGVLALAKEAGFSADRLILGGDHLGPNPWRHLPAAQAMAEAARMMADYAQAGFAKLHLDTSMACADDPLPLPLDLIATRAAELAQVAEANADPARPPVYVIGSEVPVPGGVAEPLHALAVTTPASAAATLAAHRQAFDARGLGAAFDRVIGIVVQPGVEFGSADVAVYAPDAARALVQAPLPGVVFEAHSTDYQPPAALRALVSDGFAILKVGPWLTFALRETLYGLAAIAADMLPDPPEPLPQVMERLMLADPAHWAAYYPGNAVEQRLQRHASYSDRIRYYWPQPGAEDAVAALLAALGTRPVPRPLISRHLGLLDGFAAMHPACTAAMLLEAGIARVLDIYAEATAA